MQKDDVIEKANLNIKPLIPYSAEDIARITEFFSILIKLDKKAKPAEPEGGVTSNGK